MTGHQLLPTVFCLEIDDKKIVPVQNSKMSASKFTTPIIGVIGGVGPDAGLDFVQNIFANTKAKKDQDHLNCMLMSCSSIIPDRTEYLLGQVDVNPAYGMFECARTLHLARANYVVVACNTAHSDRIFSLYTAMVKESCPDLNIINMVETCAAYAKKEVLANGGRTKRLGLLATLGTYKTNVYHEYFKENEGLLLLEPDSTGQARVHDAIYNEAFGIKSHSKPVTAKAQAILAEEIHRLVEQGAETIILGCSELALAGQPQNLKVDFMDPARICARRLIELVAPEKLI
jgi:aspartate racemase